MLDNKQKNRVTTMVAPPTPINSGKNYHLIDTIKMINFRFGSSFCCKSHILN